MKITTRQVFVIVLFLAVFLITIRPVTDPDFWWHLKTGQIIVQTHQIPSQDIYSYTVNGNPWVTHEWLSEIFIYLIYKWGSFPLLILTFSLIITAAYATAYLRTSKESRPYIAGFVLLLGAAGSNPLWGIRPQMITLLFFGLFLYFLDKYTRYHRIRNLVPLPILMILWVNLHGGFILGLGLVGIYIAGSAIDLLLQKYVKKDSVQEMWKPLWFLTGAFLLTTLATLLNPNGVRILIYPFQTLTDPSMQQYIQEWQSPDFSQAMWIPFALMVLLLVFTGLREGRTKSTTQILLVLFFCYAGLRDMRHIPLFAMAAIPVISDQLNALVTIKPTTSNPSRIYTWVNLLLILLAAFAVTARFIQQSSIQDAEVAKTYPKQAVDWIQEDQPTGHIFNSYGWGGYLIWRLYPQYQVYIDGRADVYGPSFLTDYMGLSAMKPGWQETFMKDEIMTVLIEPDSVMANFLRESKDWDIAFENDTSIIFRHSN